MYDQAGGVDQYRILDLGSHTHPAASVVLLETASGQAPKLTLQRPLAREHGLSESCDRYRLGLARVTPGQAQSGTYQRFLGGGVPRRGDVVALAKMPEVQLTSTAR